MTIFVERLPILRRILPYHNGTERQT